MVFASQAELQEHLQNTGLIGFYLLVTSEEKETCFILLTLLHTHGFMFQLLFWETVRHVTHLSLSLFLSLQCDGVPMSLPSLQGLAVLNIPSYAGGINFWGGTKEDNVSIHHFNKTVMTEEHLL